MAGAPLNDDHDRVGSTMGSTMGGTMGGTMDGAVGNVMSSMMSLAFGAGISAGRRRTQGKANEKYDFLARFLGEIETPDQKDRLLNYLQADAAFYEFAFEKSVYLYTHGEGADSEVMQRRLEGLIKESDALIKKAALEAEKDRVRAPQGRYQPHPAIVREYDQQLFRVASFQAKELQLRLFGRLIQKNTVYQDRAAGLGRRLAGSGDYIRLAHFRHTTQRHVDLRLARRLFPDSPPLLQAIEKLEAAAGKGQARSGVGSGQTSTQDQGNAPTPAQEVVQATAKSTASSSSEGSHRSSSSPGGSGLVRGSSGAPSAEVPSAPSAPCYEPGKLIALVASNRASVNQVRLFKKSVINDKSFHDQALRQLGTYKRAQARQKDKLRSMLKQALREGEEQQRRSSKEVEEDEDEEKKKPIHRAHTSRLGEGRSRAVPRENSNSAEAIRQAGAGGGSGGGRLPEWPRQAQAPEGVTTGGRAATTFDALAAFEGGRRAYEIMSFRSRRCASAADAGDSNATRRVESAAQGEASRAKKRSERKSRADVSLAAATSRRAGAADVALDVRVASDSPTWTGASLANEASGGTTAAAAPTRRHSAASSGASSFTTPGPAAVSREPANASKLASRYRDTLKEFKEIQEQLPATEAAAGSRLGVPLRPTMPMTSAIEPLQPSDSSSTSLDSAEWPLRHARPAAAAAASAYSATPLPPGLWLMPPADPALPTREAGEGGAKAASPATSSRSRQSSQPQLEQPARPKASDRKRTRKHKHK